MKVYVLIFEPYHENSTIHGVYLSEEAGMEALRKAPEGNPDPNWDDSDTWDLQEWDTETQVETRHWCNFNPYAGHYQGVSPPKKLGWRIEEQTP